MDSNVYLKNVQQNEKTNGDSKRSEKRLNIYQAQDEVDERKETLLAKVEAMLAQKIEQSKLITFHWRMI